MSHSVLVVDDDAPLREVVRLSLQLAGFSVLEAADGRQALAVVDRQAVDLVVLDVAMPVLDGLSTCRALRARADGGPPVLFLTARDDEVDRILGLELGGDDYVTKPFSPRELASRVKAILRRARPAPGGEVLRSAGPVRLDLEQRRAWVGGQEIVLTATEFDLLATLVSRPGKVYERDELTSQVWGPGHHLSDRTIDSHLRRVRHKLETAGCDRLRTVHGVGYRFAVED